MNSMFLVDFYKTIHHKCYAEGMTKLVSYWTPRKSRIEGIDKVVMFGLQSFIKEYLIKHFDENFFKVPLEDVVNEYKRVIGATMGEDCADTEHIEKLHKLGYLPIQIKAVPEGARVNIKTPMFEIRSTHDDFAWLVNYIETVLSDNIWQPMTSATIAYQFRKIVEPYFAKTVSDEIEGYVSFNEDGECIYDYESVGLGIGGNKYKNLATPSRSCGDFSMRGMPGVFSAASSGAGHLLSFTSTATIPAILFLEDYYNCKVGEDVIGYGTPSTEHSVMSSYGRDGELKAYKRLINEVFPKGVLSIVSDTYDYWSLITETLPKLKEDIMARDGKIVIRGDSGDPIDIICGSVEIESDSELTLDTIEEWYRDKAREYFNDNCDDEGYIDYVNYICCIDGKYYRVDCNASIGTERGGATDNKYFVVDGVDVTYKEVELTAAQKGTVELLWEIFGGTINSKGYKVLDPHIGTIYGDGITMHRCSEICRRLEKKGFAVSNVIFGIGSYTYQYNTRDTFGFALKATHSIINGEEVQIYKDPITDTGNFKKSQRGMCVVYKEGDNILHKDGLTIEQAENFEGNLFELVYKDGKIVKEYSLKEIRNRLQKGKF